MLVHHDITALVQLHSGRGGVQPVRVALHPCSYHQHLRLIAHLLAGGTIPADDLHASVGLPYLQHVVGGSDGDVLPKLSSYGRTDLQLLVRKQPGGALQDGHIGAEGREEVPELAPLEPASHDDHALRQLGDVEYRLGRLILHLIDPGYVGNGASRSSREHDAGGVDGAVRCLQSPLPDKADGVPDGRDPRVLLDRLGYVLPLLQNGIPCPLAHHLKVGLLDLRFDPDADAFLDLPDDVGRVDPHLARYASPVEACAPHVPVLRQCHLHS